ncbi:MAG TPA: helix-turn-helix transcriptional regulator [Candidatus Merdenecus merdavium]|nr:helix-turn-helix transcriptional regulator [Candidatus Merdenecus merdavium]
MYDFDPLWETMKKKQISTYKLINTHQISKGTLDRLKNNKNVTIETLARLCIILDCHLEDIVNIHM